MQSEGAPTADHEVNKAFEQSMAIIVALRSESGAANHHGCGDSRMTWCSNPIYTPALTSLFPNGFDQPSP